MARATYTPNAPLLLTNIQYNLTIADPAQTSFEKKNYKSVLF